MKVKVNAKFLGINSFVTKDGQLINVLHAYDGTSNLLTPFLSDELIDKLKGCNFGKNIILDMDVYLTKNNNMGQKVNDITFV